MLKILIRVFSSDSQRLILFDRACALCNLTQVKYQGFIVSRPLLSNLFPPIQCSISFLQNYKILTK